MQAMFVEDLARARIDELVKEADAYRLARIATSRERVHDRASHGRRGLLVLAWRRALAAVALSLV
jgi:hypothetical protein